MRLYHDSRDAAYRFPGGARKAGEEITLRLRITDGEATRVCLRVMWNDCETFLPMTAPQGEGLYEYALRLPNQPGLLWYFFAVETGGGTLFLGNAKDGLGGVGEPYASNPPAFQITVYDPNYITPDWMGDGILYQIMVDRFYAREKHQPPQGWLHDDWHEPPALYVPKETNDNAADDFFGGNLAGIEEKLPYLKELGVSVIYLNPIFRSPSNHKYNTGDYHQIDPSFGTEEDLRRLCARAREMGMHVMLDGVFSHTGSDSIYFNREGNYGAGGAYRSQESPYYRWYTFEHWPDKYDSWWGYETLPNVREMEESYVRFILTGSESVIRHWHSAGTSGWRLDVADELPMSFMQIMRRELKALNPDHCLLGEVWEDASNKVTYGEMRSYCLGDTLDSVMNYPLREGVIGFMTGKITAHQLKRQLDSLYENYPAPFARSLMNLLSSHDRSRIINCLSGAIHGDCPREERRHIPLTPEQYALGKARYLRAWAFVCALPGMPAIYYGDEAGAQGEDDPFCRGTYPWGLEDAALTAEIARINQARRANDVLKKGDVKLIAPDADTIQVVRTLAGHETYTHVFTRAGLI